MKDVKDKTFIVNRPGRLDGHKIRIEDYIKNIPDYPAYARNCLPTLMSMGNWAAKNALEIEKYTIDDAPFLYGKIGNLGYIVSEKDLGEEVPDGEES